MSKTDPVFLAIDIETCGIEHAVFSIGAVLFKIEDKQMSIIEERLFSFPPILPTSEMLETEDGPMEHIRYNDFTMDCWDKFWSKHLETLQYISSNATYANEKELLDAFYLWWITTTKKYHCLRIVSDNAAFDVGYTDSRIMKYRAEGSTKKPLNYQWRGKNWYYVAPIDTFSMEHIILSGANGRQCLEAIYNNCPVVADHNPINDAKKIGWQYTQLMNYF